MEYVVGVDAGGSRTRALAVARDGRVLRTYETRGGNLTLSRDAHDAIRDAVLAVIDPAERPAGLALCAAGEEDAAVRAGANALLAELVPGTRTVVANDALAGLYAASAAGVGVVIIAGTGAIAYGRTGDGRTARASGWGYLIGEEGSLMRLGCDALRAVARAVDGLEPPTALSGAVLRALGTSDLRGSLAAVYAPHPAPAILAAARALAEVPDDDAAQRVVATGANGLAEAAVAVARRLDLDDVYLAGGAFAVVPRLEIATRERLVALEPRVRVTRVLDEPVRGAARLAAALVWSAA